MIYQKTITTPADTSKYAPLRTVMMLNRGLLYQFEIYFPPGPSGLLHLQVFEKGVQIYPSTEDESIIGDNHHISFPDTYLITMPPYKIDLVTWNEDTKYEHNVIIRVGILTKDELIVRYLPKDIESVFEKYIKDKEDEHNEQNEANMSFLQEFLS